MTKKAVRVASAALLLMTCSVAGAASQFFTVRDSIEMATFVDPYPSRQLWPPSDRFKFSPDRRYVVFVTQRGLIAANKGESILWIYEASAIERFTAAVGEAPPKPRVLARMTAEFNAGTEDDPTITNVRWLPDGRLTFLGQNASTNRHLYVVNLRSGNLDQLTPTHQDVSQYDFVGDTVVYMVSANRESPVKDAIDGSQVIVGTGHSLFSLAFPSENADSAASEKAVELWVIRHGKGRAVMDTTVGRPLRLPASVYAVYGSNVLALAPSGHAAIVTSHPRRIPKEWEEYVPYPSSFGDTLRFRGTPSHMEFDDNASYAAQYAVVDLDTGRVTTLLDAPLGLSMLYYAPAQAKWSADGRELLLANTFLPLKGVSKVERRRRAERPCVAVYELASRNVTCVAPVKRSEEDVKNYQRGGGFFSLIDVAWGAEERAVVLTYYSVANGDDDSFKMAPEFYQLRDGGWEQVKDSVTNESVRRSMLALEPPVPLSVHEDLNTPEMLYVEDRASGVVKRLWNPNPQLESVDLGEASVFRWTDKSGREWVGGLVKPPNYDSANAYPLVIQTHGFARRRFLAMGAYTSASAARPLAAKGMIVLQVPDSHDGFLTAKEPKVHLEGFEAAIDKLAQEGLVEPARVGIIGFSRTCFYAITALERAPKRFAAAVIADGRMYGYMQYLTLADNPMDGILHEAKDIIGAQPFGEGLAMWLKNSPGLNLDKISAPIRMEAYGRSSLVFNWDIYAGLRMQDKPVDLIFFPEAPHVLAKPQERYGSEQGSVDWFDFWLNGHEDPDPSKAEQFARWRKLREMQNAKQTD